MARALRISFEGAWYHIMNRGTDKQPIFYNDSQRKMFLKMLAETCKKHHIEVHAYCLMGNHYHLMIRTPLANIIRAIHHLDTMYAIWFNKVLNRDGSVFRGRYHSVLVENDAHFLHLSRYIHLNPVKANLVERPEYYKWSSYRAYLGHVSPQKWLHTDEILSNFNSDMFDPNSYRAFVDEEFDLGLQLDLEKFYSRRPIPPILGSRAFIDEVKSKKKTKFDDQDVPQRKYLQDKYRLEEILDVVAKVTGVTRAKILTSTRGQRNEERLIFIFIAREKCGYKLNDIRDFMGLKCRTTITMGVKRMKKFMKEDSLLGGRVELCFTELLGLPKG